MEMFCVGPIHVREAAPRSAFGKRCRADDLGLHPLAAQCHAGLGTPYRTMGKRDEAHEHLTTATTMYREMDMWFWLEKAEAALAGD
jgi:hypothetical protein